MKPARWEIVLRPVAVWGLLGLLLGLIIDQHSMSTARSLSLFGAILGCALGARLAFRGKRK